MLTEGELLDNQTQTLEEALAKLADRETDVIEQTTVTDVGDVDTLLIAVECFKSSVDLYRTISKEGVSAADVQALRAIQARMAPIARLPTKVALEAYEGMFTPTRSMINQTVSQEAALAEIGKTLKEWFFIFVDFIIRVADWCRKVWNSEELIRVRLKGMDSYLQVMNNQLMDLVKYDIKLGRDPTPDLLALADTVLHDPKLTRSKSMVIAFNVGNNHASASKNNVQAIKNVDKMVDRYFGVLLKSVMDLKVHIEHNQPSIISNLPGIEINDMAKLLEELTVAVDDKDYLADAIRRDFWTDPKKLVTREIFAPSHNIEQVQRLAKEIRAIKRNVNFDALKEVDMLVMSIENLSEGTRGLERIIKFKQALYADYYKASATYANFYIRAREYIDEDIRRNANTDIDTVLMAKLSKAWEELLNRMGI